MLKKILIFCFSLVFAEIAPAMLCQAADQPENIMRAIESPLSNLPSLKNGEIQKINRVIIYPLRNISGNFEVPTHTFSLLIEKELKKKGFQVVPYASLDKVLTKMRIRNTNFVDRGTAARLWQELKADAILLGSIDIYSKEGNEICAGLTLRLVGSRDGSIIWANTLSHAGNDFTGILGFGKMKSLDKLGELLISGIIYGIPSSYTINNKNKRFVELAEIKVDPPVVGGGQRVKLTVGLVPMMDRKPSLVRVKVGGEIFYLRNGDRDNYYSGEIISPMMDGNFPLEIVARSYRGKKISFPAAGEVVVDMSSPEVTMKLTKNAMRGLTLKDYILFDVKSDEPVKKWTVAILDKDNKQVRSGKGYGHLPARLIWRGENDLGGVNQDGTFTFRLSVWDKAGNVGVCDELVRLDTKPPKVNIELSTDNGDLENMDEIVFNFNYDEEEMMEKWDFSLFDNESKLLKKISGRGNIDKKINISLSNKLDAKNSKKMIYTFKAVDTAGNTFESSDFIHFTKDKEEHFSKKENNTASDWIEKDF